MAEEKTPTDYGRKSLRPQTRLLNLLDAVDRKMRQNPTAKTPGVFARAPDAGRRKSLVFSLELRTPAIADCRQLEIRPHSPQDAHQSHDDQARTPEPRRVDFFAEKAPTLVRGLILRQGVAQIYTTLYVSQIYTTY